MVLGPPMSPDSDFFFDVEALTFGGFTTAHSLQNSATKDIQRRMTLNRLLPAIDQPENNTFLSLLAASIALCGMHRLRPVRSIATVPTVPVLTAVTAYA